MSDPRNQIAADKCAIVTGAGHGLGKVMVTSLVLAGANVIALDRNKKSVQELQTSLGANVIAYEGDVSSDKDIKGAVDLCLNRFERIDMIVSNAGVGPAGIRMDYHNNPIGFWEVKPDVMLNYFNINSVAPLRLANAALPYMKSQGWGRIVHVTTSLGTMIRKGAVPYGPTKAASEAMASAMAHDLEGSGITVNVLIPGGASDTDFVPDAPGLDRSELVKPSVMGPPIVWLATSDSDGFTAKRIIAKNWDLALAPREAALRCSDPIAWSKRGL